MARRFFQTRFEQQIAFAERMGLPGPGCLMAKSMIERAPHDAGAQMRVSAHNDRVCGGFLNALRCEAEARGAARAAPSEEALERAAIWVLQRSRSWPSPCRSPG